MKFLKNTGLIFILLGFGCFVGILFLNSYKLKQEHLDGLFEGASQAQLELALNPMLAKVYPNSFSFVSDLKESYGKADESLLASFQISDGELEALLESFSDPKYQRENIEVIFDQKDPDQKAKGEKLAQNTGWMEEKEYSSKEELARDLRLKVDELNSGSGSGLDSYKVKNQLFVLSKKASIGPVKENSMLLILLSLGLTILGSLLYFVPAYGQGSAGIKNNGVFSNNITSRGWIGIALGVFLILFYIVLYWYPEYMTPWVVLVDPLSMKFNGHPSSQWFLYGFLYTLAIIVMGIRMLLKYRGNLYQQIRTVSVIFFQTAFAFAIPQVLMSLNKPAPDLKNIWPLDYSFFFSYRLDELSAEGSLGFWMLGWGIALIVLGVPIITYFFGKRWYCSWVCGCGGLAETLGDPFRQLSDKSLKAWRGERLIIHSVLVFAVIMTAGSLYTYFTGASTLLGMQTAGLQKVYGFAIGAAFAGVVGTGFYPFMGNRVWCRFGCPLAAYLGMVQRFKSRFRITTNGGQCISCGNCSTYCEMGIDVRWYAQRGQNIVRSSCVGCGICSAVCPRGVLKLENGKEDGRMNENPLLIGNNGVKLKDQ